MNDELPPCPFCGHNLTIIRDSETGRFITAAHNQKVPCYLNKIAISAVPPPFVAAWCERAPGAKSAISFELQDGLPVFNEFGQGAPVDANFLNRCFDFIRKNNPWSK
jgi:hypothetical protein